MERLKQINNLVIFRGVKGRGVQFIVKNRAGKILKKFTSTKVHPVRLQERAEQFCSKAA